VQTLFPLQYFVSSFSFMLKCIQAPASPRSNWKSEASTFAVG
jgi:hypothetical protein